jgi:hypothetical protein
MGRCLIYLGRPSKDWPLIGPGEHIPATLKLVLQVIEYLVGSKHALIHMRLVWATPITKIFPVGFLMSAEKVPDQ